MQGNGHDVIRARAGGQITALVYAHRARPPDSTRVTVTSLQLAPP